MSAVEVHQALVDQLIALGALWSSAAVAAFQATPRHLFLDRIYYRRKDSSGIDVWRGLRTRPLSRVALRLIYSDRALVTRLSDPAGGSQAVAVSSSSQPSLMGRMLEDLRLAPGLRVLEIGTGTGYNAALLAHIVGQVVSVEVDRRVLTEARRHLAALPDRTVTLIHEDGRQGVPAEAPFDRILVTAATPDLEPAWLAQLAPGGLLLAPWELAPGLAFLVCGRVEDGSVFEGRLVRPAYFMPLRAEDDSGSSAERGSGELPAPESLERAEAPWTHWPRRRTQLPGPGFLTSLAFLAWLQGWVVRVQGRSDTEMDYGVGDLAQGPVCWMNMHEWRISGSAGRDLGRRLWQTFLDLGGPWPTDFHLRAWPTGTRTRPSSRGVVFHRQGPLSEQRWELIEPRDRR